MKGGSHNDNNETESVLDLFGEKLNNAKERFRPHAEKHGLGAKLQNLTRDVVIAELISQRLMWALLEAEETEFLLSLLEGAKNDQNAAEVERFIMAVRDLSDEELKLAWRYVKFFIKCLKA